tara:strand:+ start:666 stop:953 length:288 start_codon:yes stop_codon:yes gene_type:complete
MNDDTLKSYSVNAEVMEHVTSITGRQEFLHNQQRSKELYWKRFSSVVAVLFFGLVIYHLAVSHKLSALETQVQSLELAIIKSGSMVDSTHSLACD